MHFEQVAESQLFKLYVRLSRVFCIIYKVQRRT
uniref:Uncharacterized protein n=1 Tax=Anguilla anguilla TaxID=7936 RepID=A0A0E9XV61_ANGAN